MCFQRSGAIIPRSSSFIAKRSLLFPGLLNGGVIDYFMMSLASYSQRILNGLLEQNITGYSFLIIYSLSLVIDIYDLYIERGVRVPVGDRL